MKKAFVFCAMLLVVFGLTGCARMDIKSNSFTLELGDNPNQYKAEYVKLKGAEMDQVEFDFSEVDYNKIGIYQAKATFGKQIEEFFIEVKDTVAPQITYHNEVTAEKGEIISLKDIIISVMEKSGMVMADFEGMENKVSADMLTIDGISFGNIELLYEEAGEYDETLVISDNSGNSSSYKLHIMVIEDESEACEDDVEMEIIATEQAQAEQGETEVIQETAVVESVSDGESVPQNVLPVETGVDWVSGLSVAQQTNQLIVVAANGIMAQVSMHTKDQFGNWQQNLSTVGYVGRDGVGQASEYVMCSPRGVWSFGVAFGNQANPGIAMEYTMVDDTYYWVDDVNSSYYNRFVSTRDVTPDWSSAEHIQSCGEAYNYVLSINYNTECVPGNGSAFFLHCSTGAPTAGCIAVPESVMIQIMQLYQTGCLIVIDQEDAIQEY